MGVGGSGEDLTKPAIGDAPQGPPPGLFVVFYSFIIHSLKNCIMTDKEALKLFQQSGSTEVAVTTLAPGNYICQKTTAEIDARFRKTGSGERFTPISETAKPSKDDNTQMLFLAGVKIIYPRAKQRRLSVPASFLEGEIGAHYSFSVQANGFANFRDEPLSEEQVKLLMAETV